MTNEKRFDLFGFNNSSASVSTFFDVVPNRLQNSVCGVRVRKKKPIILTSVDEILFMKFHATKR